MSIAGFEGKCALGCQREARLGEEGWVKMLGTVRMLVLKQERACGTPSDDRCCCCRCSYKGCHDRRVSQRLWVVRMCGCLLCG